MKTGWIKCSDRLPELGKRVLVCFIGGISGVELLKVDCLIKYHNNNPEWQYTSGPNRITHWMPLPPPPKI